MRKNMLAAMLAALLAFGIGACTTDDTAEDPGTGTEEPATEDPAAEDPAAEDPAAEDPTADPGATS